jgi:hypothetical protein
MRPFKSDRLAIAGPFVSIRSMYQAKHSRIFSLIVLSLFLGPSPMPQAQTVLIENEFDLNVTGGFFRIREVP